MPEPERDLDAFLEKAKVRAEAYKLGRELKQGKFLRGDGDDSEIGLLAALHLMEEEARRTDQPKVSKGPKGEF